jgi:hypothetical protein
MALACRHFCGKSRIHESTAANAENSRQAVSPTRSDAMQRVNHANPILCIRINGKGEIKWSRANKDFKSLSMIAVVAIDLAQSPIRDDLK